MWLLITFIIVWALSPGPVAVMTLHESRKNGSMAGVAVSGGAAITSTMMVVIALILHTVGVSAMLETENTVMTMIERIGAFGIIFMGVYAGYKSLMSNKQDDDTTEIQSGTKFGIMQGMMVMATYIPQALFYYNVIIPQTVEPQNIITTIMLLGTLKVVLIFGWHSIIAIVSGRSQNWLSNKRITSVLELATAGLIMGLGINILL